MLFQGLPEGKRPARPSRETARRLKARVRVECFMVD
jgi:hypothetical protein